MMIRTLFFLILTFITQVNSQSYLIHEFDKNYPNIVSSIKNYDISNNHMLADYGPIKSYKTDPVVYNFPGVDVVFLLAQQRKSKLQIHILDKKTLALKSIIDTKKLTKEFDQLVEVNFIRLINNNQELAVVVGSPGSKALVIYDLTSFKEVFRHKVGSRNTVAKLSDDGQFIYFIENNQLKNNKQLQVINIKNKKVLPSISQGDDDAVIYSFQNYLMVSNEISLSKNDTTKYWQLNVYNLYNPTQAVGKPLLSNRQQQFEKIGNNKKLLIANRTHKSPFKVDIYEFQNGDLTPKEVDTFDVKLTDIQYNKNSNLLMLLGNKQIAVLDMAEGKLKSELKVAFVAESGIINSKATHAFVKTEMGSRVVMIDLDNNRVVNELINGSFSNRAGGAIAGTLMIASAYYLSGMVVIPDIESNLFMQFNDTESKLFVRSQKTDDITVYNAETFDQQHTINSGQDTFSMVKNVQANKPFVVLSKYKATLLNAADGEALKTIKYEQFLNFNSQENLLLVQGKYKAELYSTINGEKLKTIGIKNGKEAFYLSN